MFLVVFLNWSERLKSIKKKVIKSLYEVLINLNMFHRHNFGSHLDRITAKYYGKLATRLYFILFTTSFAILMLYAIIQQQMMTKNFNKPSFETYNKLIQIYGDQLKCSCSSISSVYDQFLKIEPVFHEICSSSFASDEMINNMGVSLSSNLLVYEKRDYRRLISSHNQYLRGLCQISIESINNSIEQLRSQLFISKDLLLEYDFNEQINELIEQTKQNARHNLNSIFFLIRNINFGNAIISTYGTNFKYVANINPESDDFNDNFLKTETEIYDNNCWCALQPNCTSQAYFIGKNSSEEVPLKGLKIGCTPTESFLSSTLECFYDDSCVSAIKEYTNYTYSLESLSNQSQINFTIGELVQNLFIDRWLTTKNYSSYYQQCLPLLCSYTYMERFNLIYIASFLFSLQGGLTIVLKWICPKIIQFVIIIKRIRKTRSNTVRPEHVGEATSTEIDNTKVSNNTNTFELNRACGALQYLKAILSCLLIMIFIVLVIIFSIYIVQHAKNSTTQATSMFFLYNCIVI